MIRFCTPAALVAVAIAASAVRAQVPPGTDVQREALRAAALAEEAARDAASLEASRAQWANLLARRIVKFWTRPVGTADRFTCKFQMELNTDGSVRSVSMIQGCGSESLDRSVLTAVHKASPLPLPSLPSAFEPTVIMVLCPSPGACAAQPSD